MTTETQDKLKAIKQTFRLRMDGMASRSMREKGLEYHLNWGVSLPDLKQLAKEYGKDYPLAIELWKENIRECKILATMIMPPEQMLPEIAELWMEQTESQEIAEMLAFNLFQYLDYAPMLAFRWIAGNEELPQVCVPCAGAPFHAGTRAQRTGNPRTYRPGSHGVTGLVARRQSCRPYLHPAICIFRR